MSSKEKQNNDTDKEKNINETLENSNENQSEDIKESQVNDNKKIDQMEILNKTIAQLTLDNDKYLRTAATYKTMYNQLQEQLKTDVAKAIEREKQGFIEVIIGFREIIALAIDSTMKIVSQDEKNPGNNTYQSILEGIKMLDRQVMNTMREKYNLEEVSCDLKENFDYNIHEAIGQTPCEDKELNNKISNVVKVGYKINDRLIRSPKVEVYKFNGE